MTVILTDGDGLDERSTADAPDLPSPGFSPCDAPVHARRSGLRRSYFTPRTTLRADGNFLCDHANGAVYELNSTARAAVENARSGASFPQLVEALCVQFPDVERGTLDRDLAELLEDLVHRRLFHARAAERPGVSIIIPAFNAAGTIERCLESVMALDFPAEEFEVIVIDNNSTDETPYIVDRYPVLHEFAGVRSRSVARNVGCRLARGEILAFIDADTAVTPDWLTEMVRGLDAPNVGVCQGAIFVPGSNEINRTAAKPPRFFGILPPVGTAACAMRARACAEGGYFDEALSRHEDSDLAWRVVHAGYDMRFVDTARATAEQDWTARTAIRRSAEMAKADARFYSKWFLHGGARNLVKWTAGVTMRSVEFFGAYLSSRAAADAFWALSLFVRAFTLPLAVILGRDRGSRPRIAERHAPLAIDRGVSFRLAPDVRVVFDAGGAYLVPLQRGGGYRTNSTGAHMIDTMLASPRPVPLLASELSSRFDIGEERAAADLRTLLADLKDRGLVTSEAADAASEPTRRAPAGTPGIMERSAS